MLMPQPSPGLVWAFRIRADGTAAELDVDQPLGDYPDGWLWLHFNLVEAPACAFLKSLPDLPPAAIDAMVQRHHHLQLHVSAACVYGVIADLCCTISGVEDQFGFLHFVMTDRYLITGRRRTLNAVEATRQALHSGQRVASAASLLELIIEHVAQAIDNLTPSRWIRSKSAFWTATRAITGKNSVFFAEKPFACTGSWPGYE